MIAVSMRCDGRGHALERRIWGEGPEELVVAFAGLVRAGDDGVRDAELHLAPDPSARNAIPGPHAAVAVRRRFERPDDRRSNGDDPPAARLRAIDGRCSSLENVKELIQRETRVQRRASGRGEPGGVSEGGEADAAPPPDRQRSPFERKSG